MPNPHTSMSITVAIACANSSFVPYAGTSNLQAFASHRQVVTCTHNTQLSTFSRYSNTTRKPVEARVCDRIHGAVAGYRFQTEATELGVMRLPPRHKSTTRNHHQHQQLNAKISHCFMAHRSATCTLAIVHCENSLLLQRSLAQYTIKPTCIARNPSTGT